jgi:predicted RNA binding protein YcfA (HicA-like mRNA interferase family)
MIIFLKNECYGVFILNRIKISLLIERLLKSMTFESRLSMYEQETLDSAFDIMGEYEMAKANLLNDAYNKCCILLYNLKNIDLISNSSLDLATIINNYIIEFNEIGQEFNKCIDDIIIKYKSIDSKVYGLQIKLFNQMSLYAKCKKDHQLLAARLIKFNNTTTNIYDTLDKSCKYEYSILKEIKSEIESLQKYTDDKYVKEYDVPIIESNKIERKNLIKIFDYKEMVRLAQENNYRQIRCNGDHLILIHNESNKIVVIPAHDLGYGLMIKIQNQIENNKLVSEKLA